MNGKTKNEKQSELAIMLAELAEVDSLREHLVKVIARMRKVSTRCRRYRNEKISHHD